MKRKLISLVIFMLVLSMAAAPMSAMAAASRIVQVLKVNVEGARLREGPSSEYNVITSLPKNSRVFYLGQKSAAFCCVRTTDGKTGYVYDGFLDMYGAVRMDQIYYAVKNSVPVYKKASTSSGYAGTLNANDHIIVFRTSGEWGFIKNLNGRSGFVKLNSLAPVA